MVDNHLFEDIKSELEDLGKLEIINIEKIGKLSNITLLTDAGDDFSERISEMKEFCSLSDTKLHPLFIYDLKSTYQLEGSEESLTQTSLVDKIKKHSQFIKKLKLQGFDIVLEDTVQNFLVELREVRQTSDDDLEEFSVEEVEALADFLMSDVDREDNFVEAVIKEIQQENADLVIWKPPLLLNREQHKSESLRSFSFKILEKLSNDMKIIFLGDQPLASTKNVLCLLPIKNIDQGPKYFGQNLLSIFEPSKSLEIKYLVFIEDDEIGIASLLEDEMKIKEIKNSLIEKLETKLNKIRINNKKPEFEIVFGQLESKFPPIIRTEVYHMIVLKAEDTPLGSFDEEIISLSRIATREGISVLVL